MTQSERPEGDAVKMTRHTDTWHVGRSFGSTHLEDTCPCPQEACGLVARDRVDPRCPQHTATSNKTIRQAHRPDACPGVRTPPATAVDWDELKDEILDPQDMPFVEAYKEELVKSLAQYRAGDVLPAVTVAETRVRAAQERLLSYVPTPDDGVVHAAFLEELERYRRAVLLEAHRAIGEEIRRQEWSDLFTEGLEAARYVVGILHGDDEEEGS